MPEICYHCGTMAENDTFSKDVISKDHAVCHGWFHCGPGCCGDCYVCEEDTVLGVNDFSSLEALRSAYRKQEESYVQCCVSHWCDCYRCCCSASSWSSLMSEIVLTFETKGEGKDDIVSELVSVLDEYLSDEEFASIQIEIDGVMQ